MSFHTEKNNWSPDQDYPKIKRADGTVLTYSWVNFSFAEFVAQFNGHDSRTPLERCLDYLEGLIGSGRIDASENVLPSYAVSDDGSISTGGYRIYRDDVGYDEDGNEYPLNPPNTHSYEISIEDWDLIEDEHTVFASVRFEDVVCNYGNNGEHYNAMTWFRDNLMDHFDIEYSEMHWNNPELQQKSALRLQLSNLQKRLVDNRQYLREQAQTMSPNTLDAYCVAIAEMIAEIKRFEDALAPKMSNEERAWSVPGRDDLWGEL